MRYGVGNSTAPPHGVGRIPGEWSPRYGVEIWSGSGNLVWEWGIRSGGVGVGVFIMPLQSHTLPHSIVPHPPIPHSTHIQSIPNQSNSAVSSHKDCVSISGGWAGSGTNGVGTINSLCLWSGAYSAWSPSTVLQLLRTSDLPLSYSATTFGVGRIKPLLIHLPEWGIFAFHGKSLCRPLLSKRCP